MIRGLAPSILPPNIRLLPRIDSPSGTHSETWQAEERFSFLVHSQYHSHPSFHQIVSTRTYVPPAMPGRIQSHDLARKEYQSISVQRIVSRGPFGALSVSPNVPKRSSLVVEFGIANYRFLYSTINTSTKRTNSSTNNTNRTYTF